MLSSVSENGFSCLPFEIWSKVFSYLSIDDRKNVRLSCRLFYEVFSSFALQRTEEIAFYGNFNIDAAMEFFSNNGNERKIWNIKLHQVSLFSVSILSFFRKEGNKVHSLIINDCKVAPGLLSDIIMHCENLKDFDLLLPNLSGTLSPEDFEIIFSDFKALYNARMTCPNVTNFTFVFGVHDLWRKAGTDSILTNKIFLQFFTIFPNIKGLDLKFHVKDENFIHDDTALVDLISENKLTLSCIYYHLHNMRFQLERLNLFINSYNISNIDFIFQSLCKISLIEMKNLKKRSLNIHHLKNPSLILTYPEVKYLTDITCPITEGLLKTISGSSFIQLIFNTAKELHSLTIDIHTRFDIDKNCFLTLVKSNLETLIIKELESMKNAPVFITFNFENLFLENITLPNYTLKILDLNVADSNVILFFCTHFHGLETLIFANCEKSILEVIFQYQAKLRCLKLYNFGASSCEEIHTFPSDQHWLKNQNKLNVQLDHLLRLFISFSVPPDVPEFLLNNLVFSKLKSLHINLNPSYTKDNIFQNIQKLTELEYLMVNWNVVISFSQWLDLFSTLSKLRYVIILDDTPKPLDDSNYRQLFQVCAPLRILFHGYMRFNHRSRSVRYVKHVITNTVKKEPISKSTPFFDLGFEEIPSEHLL